jgi:glucan phosphoethanolaminetransferase (alkaline phosphatase superfamily)
VEAAVRALRAAIAAGLVLACAGAIAGAGDLAENAVSFSALEGLQTTLLWIALAAVAALPLALAAAGACLAFPRRSSSAIAAAIAWAALQAGILAGAKLAWFGIPVAVLASIANLAAAAWLARRADPLAGLRWRAAVLIGAALLASAVLVGFRPHYAAGGGGSASGPSGPNVVVVVLDTLRADHLGAYGDARGLSPAFDALARQGTLFEDAYANAPWTVPSHASLFTGSPRARTARRRSTTDGSTTASRRSRRR